MAQGQIHGLVGPNGAGKTTLLGLLLGLAVADSGRLEILGTPIARALAAPDGVAGFVDGPGLYPSLTARQNLAALAVLRGQDTRTTVIDDVLDQVGLTDVADDRASSFSLGMRQRLGLAAALLTKPRLLVLDEPSNGLDPAGKKHVHGVLTRLAGGGNQRRTFEPPHGRRRGAVLRGHHPRHGTGRLLRPTRQAGRRKP
nr:ATP-binding cassette domain-containing protein [Micromonospora sp. CB01531]